MKFLKGFVLGFFACWYIWKFSSQISSWLQVQIAKLELKQDILKHDNPDLQ